MNDVSEPTPGQFIEEIKGPPEIAPTAIDGAAFVGAATSGPLSVPVPVSSAAQFEAVFGTLAEEMPMGYAVRDFFNNGGRSALIVRIAHRGDHGMPDSTPPLAIDYVGSADDRTGLQALKGSKGFGTLCIPPPAPGLDLEPSVWAAAADLCREVRALLLIDPPVEGAAAWSDTRSALFGVALLREALGDAGDLAAVYYPRFLEPGPQPGQPPTRAVCGAVAGVIARNDLKYGPWRSPSGAEANLTGAAGLSMPLSSTEAAELGYAGINCLRSLQGPQIVVWGARTLAAPGSYTMYLPVRRMALFLETSIAAGTQWAVFEPNDETLWAGVRAAVSTFLQGLFTRGAFQGSRPEDAYFVKCDRSTISQSDIDNGVLNIVVGFAPLMPAEFVILRFQHLLAGN